MIYYFAYGMLTNPDIMSDSELVGVAELKNFKLEWNQFANVTEDHLSSVMGALWKISPEFLLYLDQIEGYPDLYHRIQVPVTIKNQEVLAWVYIQTKSTRNRLVRNVPSKSYLNTVRQGYLATGIPLNSININQ